MSKVFVLVLLLIAIQCSLQAPNGKDMMGKLKKCYDLLSQESKAKIKAKEIPEGDDVKKYARCVYEVIGFMKGDGTLNEEMIKKVLEHKLGSKDKANEMYEKCVKTAGTPEETAFNSAKCFQENNVFSTKKSE